MRKLMLVGVISFLQACGSPKHELKQYNDIEDFEYFYQRFNADSLFQRERFKMVKYPGYHFDANTIDFDLYGIEIKKANTRVVQRIYYKADTSNYIKYVFEIREAKWYTVSYVDTWDDFE